MLSVHLYIPKRLANLLLVFRMQRLTRRLHRCVATGLAVPMAEEEEEEEEDMAAAAATGGTNADAPLAADMADDLMEVAVIVSDPLLAILLLGTETTLPEETIVMPPVVAEGRKPPRQGGPVPDTRIVLLGGPLRIRSRGENVIVRSIGAIGEETLLFIWSSVCFVLLCVIVRNQERLHRNTMRDLSSILQERRDKSLLRYL